MLYRKIRNLYLHMCTLMHSFSWFFLTLVSTVKSKIALYLKYILHWILYWIRFFLKRLDVFGLNLSFLSVWLVIFHFQIFLTLRGKSIPCIITPYHLLKLHSIHLALIVCLLECLSSTVFLKISVLLYYSRFSAIKLKIFDIFFISSSIY